MSSIKNSTNMILNMEEATEFSKWMQKIKSIHFPDNKRMLIAYGRIEALKRDVRNDI